MKNSLRTVTTVESHTEGMPTRVVTSGIEEIPGKTMFEKRDDLIAAHKEATNLRLDGQKQAATPIPYHPGAARYFAERGIKLN